MNGQPGPVCRTAVGNAATPRSDGARQEEREVTGLPRIKEATLSEHRTATRTCIIQAAESILRTGGRRALTMAAVGRKTGLARNSIYRYAKDADALCDLVLERHLPSWSRALTQALDGVEDPAETIVVWTRTNLIQAGEHGHGWLMDLYAGDNDEDFRRAFRYATTAGGRAGTAPLAERPPKQAMVDFHHAVNQPLIDAWRALRPEGAWTGVEVTRGILQSGMRLMDALTDRPPCGGQAVLTSGERRRRVNAVMKDVTAATRAVVDALGDDGDASLGSGCTGRQPRTACRTPAGREAGPDPARKTGVRPFDRPEGNLTDSEGKARNT